MSDDVISGIWMDARFHDGVWWVRHDDAQGQVDRLKAEVERLKAATKKALAVNRSNMVAVPYMGDTMHSAQDGDWCYYDDVAEALGGSGDE